MIKKNIMFVLTDHDGYSLMHKLMKKLFKFEKLEASNDCNVENGMNIA